MVLDATQHHAQPHERAANAGVEPHDGRHEAQADKRYLLNSTLIESESDHNIPSLFINDLSSLSRVTLREKPQTCHALLVTAPAPLKFRLAWNLGFELSGHCPTSREKKYPRRAHKSFCNLVSIYHISFRSTS